MLHIYLLSCVHSFLWKPAFKLAFQYRCIRTSRLNVAVSERRHQDQRGGQPVNTCSSSGSISFMVFVKELDEGWRFPQDPADKSQHPSVFGRFSLSRRLCPRPQQRQLRVSRVVQLGVSPTRPCRKLMHCFGWQMRIPWFCGLSEVAGKEPEDQNLFLKLLFHVERGLQQGGRN